MVAQLLDDPREVLFHHPEIRRTAPETAVMEFPVGSARFTDTDHLLRLLALKPPPALASAGPADLGHVSGNRLIYHLGHSIISGLSFQAGIPRLRHSCKTAIAGSIPPCASILRPDPPALLRDLRGFLLRLGLRRTRRTAGQSTRLPAEEALLLFLGDLLGLLPGDETGLNVLQGQGQDIADAESLSVVVFKS